MKKKKKKPTLKKDKPDSPDLSSLFESWSKEFSSQINRVFDLIAGSQHYELGRHRELLFRNFLRKYLPDVWEVSTGFIIGNDQTVSKQQDVIIWDASSCIPYLREGEFVIVPQNAVMALIEVKTNLEKKDISDALGCLHSEMFYNWRLGEPNPFHKSKKNLLYNVPFRGIFALRSAGENPVKKIFGELIEFYSNLYPTESVKDIILEHRGDGLRYTNIIDAICVLEDLAIHQDTLLIEGGKNKWEPCFTAWSFGSKKQTKALAWFLNYIYQEINRKVVPEQVRYNVIRSRGKETTPFLCRLSANKEGEILKFRRAKLCKNDIFKTTKFLW